MRNSWEVGTAVARWNVSAVQSRVYRGDPRPMPIDVDYRFENGWVATGDMPCREALRAEIAGRVVDLPDVDFPEVYLGGPSGDVDYSDFCHVPEWRVRHAQVRLHAGADQVIRLRISTAGGVHLWCDKTHVLAFEPFTRNIRQQTQFDMPVAAGVQTLTVRFEDLHERDTNYGFRLDLIEGTGLETEITSDVPADQLAQATALLDGLRTEQVFHETGKVRVTSDALGEQTFAVFCLEAQGQGGGLSKTSPGFDIDLPAGCPVLRFAITLGSAQVVRRLGTTVLTGVARLEGHDLAARKVALLRRQDCGDDIVTALLAASEGGWSVAAQACFDDAIARVEDRHDCADFRMMSLLWLWARHRDQLPEASVQRLSRAILGFRYWLDEPGNDVMWFWSENHALCFHVAQHLAGQMMPEAVFINANVTGAQHRDAGAARLHRWFDAIDHHGLAEWNSAAYYPINYRGLLALFTLTDDVALKARAKALLDRISTMVALHLAGGVAAGSQGRIYEKELLAGPMTELGAVAALMFGGWHVPGKDAAAVMLAVSAYAPDPSLTALAHPPKGQKLRARYRQGLDGEAQLRLFKTGNVQLSSVVHHKPGQAGHQQHVVDLQLSADPMARIWVNHPGVLRHWAEARPSFWAGNGRMPDVDQRDGIVAMRYALTDQDPPFTHLFLPLDRLDQVVLQDQWAFVRAGQGFAAIWSAKPLQRQSTGLYAGCEFRQPGPLSAWAIRVGDSTDGDFETFITRAQSATPIMAGETLIVPTHCGEMWLGSESKATAPAPSDFPIIETSRSANGPWSRRQDTTE